ncbi:MAG: GNAT family N-acetyltransferase [Candidatus Cloacimonetes bacterium]|nr:GNAT family N-acetyltransferase [Candidatus Cloacimonadota bacterium]
MSEITIVHKQDPVHSLLKRRSIANYRSKIRMFIDKKNFVIKTADTPEELIRALRLRHEVFLEELLHKSKRTGIDFDRFDRTCDHLMIIDKRNDLLIGTYRLQSSLHTKRWYTATEFHMKLIKKLEGNKLELGRACVHHEYRNGLTIALLWEGIHAYMLTSDTKYMFGCSSIKTMDKEEIKGIYNYLRHNGHILDDHKVRPRSKFRVPGLRRHLRRNTHTHTDGDLSHFKAKIPSLLNSYLKVGAKVCGAPALDKSFKCIDFLTLLDVEMIQQQYTRKMNTPGSEGEST